MKPEPVSASEWKCKWKVPGRHKSVWKGDYTVFINLYWEGCRGECRQHFRGEPRESTLSLAHRKSELGSHLHTATAIIEAGMWSRSHLVHWDHMWTGKFTLFLKCRSGTWVDAAGRMDTPVNMQTRPTLFQKDSIAAITTFPCPSVCSYDL